MRGSGLEAYTSSPAFICGAGSEPGGSADLCEVVGMRTWLIVSVVLVTASGCGVQKADLMKLERDIAALRTSHSEQLTEMEGVRAELRQLAGRLDELDFQQRRTAPDLKNLESSLTTLKRRVPPPAIVPAATLELDERQVAELDSASGGDAAREALLKVREGAFQEALPLLRSAYDLSAGAAWGATMLFWQGVANDGLGDNRAALAAYHELGKTFPQHQRVPLSMMRLGSVLIRLGDSKSARLTFEKLIQGYPKSSEAKLAKDRLKDLAG